MADKPRSVWAEGTLNRIRAVYGSVAGCPKWDDMSPALRTALLLVYMLGRKDAIEEPRRS
jgi:hypothetical protein